MNVVDKKVCSSCDELKDLNEFNRNSTAPDGRRHNCRDCQRTVRREHYEKNADSAKTQAARWRKENPETQKTYRAHYYRAHVEQEKARAVQERIERPDVVRARTTSWKRTNRSAVRTYEKGYRKRPYAKVKKAACDKSWVERNRDKKNTANANRRAKAARAEGSHTAAEWKVLLAKYNHHCLRCQKHESEVGPMTRDHVQPLELGGSNWIANIQPLCGPCNSSKGVNHIDYRPQEIEVETRG